MCGGICQICGVLIAPRDYLCDDCVQSCRGISAAQCGQVSGPLLVVVAILGLLWLAFGHPIEERIQPIPGILEPVQGGLGK
jgi:hypothetical protein